MKMLQVKEISVKQRQVDEMPNDLPEETKASHATD